MTVFGIQNVTNNKNRVKALICMLQTHNLLALILNIKFLTGQMYKFLSIKITNRLNIF